DWSTKCIARIYRAYEGILAEQRGLDFDDLLLKMAMLLRCDDELRRQLEQRYTHLLVDEYQDTNRAQYEIARLMTEGNRNLCVTGDPDQSIYGWRGADIRNILDFEKDYPEATTVRLEQNYRSTQRILAAADTLIAFNTQRKAKALWTENDEGRAVRVVRCADGQAEARFIAGEIGELRRNGRALRDIAIFYRINALSRTVEEELINAGIPYQVARGVEFYNRKEVKDVLAYLRVMVNHADEVSLLRIINTPARGIGSTTVKRLQQHAAASGQLLFDVIRDASTLPDLGRAAGKVAFFAELMQKLEPLAGGPPAATVGAVVSESGIRATLREEARTNPERLENVDELISAAATFEQQNPGTTLPDFLQHVSLISDVDSVDSESGCVTLMTLHAAKGLEFPVVYMIGLESGLLPMVRDDDSDDEEEERRLCFVGMTRAMKVLTLTNAAYRTLHGRTERRIESIFLSELPDAQIEWVDEQEDVGADAAGERPRPELPHDIELWEVGTLVRHPKYGLARVRWMHPGGQQTRIGLRFRDGEDKTFILEYADLQRVDYDEMD
ncbi:MAG: UvrD-helicase domain-containing protein, partial [Phycisphaerales bacterium]